MADEKFEVGDVVQLKSGGPKMTVYNIVKDAVWCRWFEGKKKRSGVFVAAELQKSDHGAAIAVGRTRQ